jgi:hypothetical protein
MPKILACAVRHLECDLSISLIDRLILICRFDLVAPKWKEDAMVDLVLRKRKMSMKEAKAIGLETTFVIGDARERLAAKQSDAMPAWSPPGLSIRDSVCDRHPNDFQIFGAGEFISDERWIYKVSHEKTWSEISLEEIAVERLAKERERLTGSKREMAIQALNIAMEDADLTR